LKFGTQNQGGLAPTEYMEGQRVPLWLKDQWAAELQEGDANGEWLSGNWQSFGI